MLLRELWSNRSRPPSGSADWWRTWAKRLAQTPVLVRQLAQHARLKRCGASVDPSAFLSDASLITGNHGHLTVGARTFVGRVQIALHAPVTIGSHVCINDGAKLLTGSHDVRDPAWTTVTKPIVVEDYCWIATNALILPGVRIGRGAVVGAGAVVSRDVPALAVAVGNPAQIVEARRPAELCYDPTAGLALVSAWCGNRRPVCLPLPAES